MRKLVRVLALMLAVMVVLAAAGLAWLRQADRYQAEGTMRLPVLSAPVRVLRDEQGVPYLYAGSIDDALRAQGFVTAQDRLLNIEFGRHLANGRLAELIGEPGLKSDVQVRVVGIPTLARRHAELLSGGERRRRELYLEGLNAYIREHADEHPVTLRVLGIRPQPWTLADSMALSYFVNWSSSANLDAELIGQAIVERVGPERAATITQLTVNPDGGTPVAARPAALLAATGFDGGAWLAPGPRPLQLGSNAWVVGGARSSGGAPVLVNNPHIDARTLPGRWHPIGMVAPGLRAVGVAGPGLPGLAVARTERLAYGVTNSYGDVVDLYLEREDPERAGHYLEGAVSLPFEVREESLRVRAWGSGPGYREVPLRIRRTRRGPVISDHDMGAPRGRVISMRWSVAESMHPDDSGGTDLMLARSLDEARAAIARVNAPYNYVVADVDGNIGQFAAGRVPVRQRGDGSAPLPVRDAEDDWAGMIPPGAMPALVNPARGWAGNANHRWIPDDFPYAYSTYFASSWRYRRLLELLDAPPPERFSAEDHWRFMRDTGNAMAAAVTPLMVNALGAHADTRDLAGVLNAWDRRDDPQAVGPTVFHATWREFARLVFEDELGPELTAQLLDSYYYWQERLVRLCDDDADPWFDDGASPARETRDELLHRAASRARADLAARLGPDMDDWRWGRLHTITFFSPAIPGRWAAGLLGGGTRPMEGSGETLNRATWRFAAPFDAVFIDSLRFVADLADPDKVMAVLPGGASGRQFDPHLDDQLDAWASGEPRYLWFSDAEIARHARHELRLEP
jgi:penicillin amidase